MESNPQKIPSIPILMCSSFLERSSCVKRCCQNVQTVSFLCLLVFCWTWEWCRGREIWWSGGGLRIFLLIYKPANCAFTITSSYCELSFEHGIIRIVSRLVKIVNHFRSSLWAVSGGSSLTGYMSAQMGKSYQIFLTSSIFIS